MRSAVSDGGRQDPGELAFHAERPDIRGGRFQQRVDAADGEVRARDPALCVQTTGERRKLESERWLGAVSKDEDRRIGRAREEYGADQTRRTAAESFLHV